MTRGCRLRHTSRPHDNAGMVLHQVGDNLGGLGHGQGDFDDENPALRYCLRGKDGVLLRLTREPRQ